MEIKKYTAQSQTDEKIKQNVEIVVAKRLQDLTHSLRQRQRKYVAKIKELNGGEESKINLSDDEDVTNNFPSFLIANQFLCIISF